jgi:arylsulfatase A-like enzyme
MRPRWGSPWAKSVITSQIAINKRILSMGRINIIGRWMLIVMGLAWLGMPTASQAEQQPSQPNVVVILTDDQGWGDLGITGNPNFNTPHIDQLARQGARLKHFYVAPVCSPTRAAFLTGRYHPRTGVRHTSAGGERIDLDEHTIAETFKAAGYATGIFGKWHNGTQYPYHPLARGFDTFYGFTSGHWAHYFSPQLEHNQQLVEGDGYITNDLTDHALKFIEKNQDQPFFCYVPYNTPHSPMQVPDRFYKQFDDEPIDGNPRYSSRENIAKTRAALAMCKNIDWNVGRILGKLKRLDLAKNTIVVYFSDNGPNGWRWNGGMRGRKGWTDEGGVRVPGFVRWPGQIEAGTTIDQIAGAIDLLPTLTDLAGIEPQHTKPLDGQSLKPLLLEQADGDWPDRRIFSHWRGRVSVRNETYRLDHKGRLYNIDKDPGQHRDVSDQHPQVTSRLQAAIKQWKTNVLSQLDQPARPFPVGYEAFPITRLPARDGKAHGTIERNNRFPNASFFEQWQSEDDRITWDVRINTPGKYAAFVHYTCAKENLGVELALTFRDRTVKTKVTEAFDPPLHGKAHDRIKRIEGYTKAFKRLRLGTVDLPAGRDPLTLTAPTIPGSEAVDVRYVSLKLIEPAE